MVLVAAIVAGTQLGTRIAAPEGSDVPIDHVLARAYGLEVDLTFVNVEAEPADGGTEPVEPEGGEPEPDEPEAPPAPQEPADPDPAPADPDDVPPQGGTSTTGPDQLARRGGPDAGPEGAPDPDDEPPGPDSGTSPGAGPAEDPVVVEWGPAPLAEVGSRGGGPITEALDDVVVPVPVGLFPRAGHLEARAHGRLGVGGSAEAGALVEDLDLAGVVAEQITVDCEATGAGTRVDTTFEGLEIMGEEVADPEPGQAMTDVDLDALADDLTITFDERVRITADDGTESIRVTAIHIEAAEGGTSDVDGEVRIGVARCGAS